VRGWCPGCDRLLLDLSLDLAIGPRGRVPCGARPCSRSAGTLCRLCVDRAMREDQNNPSHIHSELPEEAPMSESANVNVAGEGASQAVGSNLLGRVALITGGTRGIGAAISEELASQGATVAVGFSRDVERANQFARDFADRFSAPVSTHRGNVASPDDCRRVVNEVIEQHGRLDILINNAGITIDKTILKLTDDDWRKVLDVNLSGAFFLSQAVLGHMVERGSGRIINVSSIIGEMGNIGQANYAASKSGLFGLTKTFAREAAFLLERSGKLTDDSTGITVNTVAPGYTLTDMVAAVPEKVLDRIKTQIPLRRFGRPEEVARIVGFLAADESSYITGQVWGVNGGMDM
jgi:NAD(P)-dependent dehydrogenase (short-subunit alcohol dehydrogenase family)